LDFNLEIHAKLKFWIFKAMLRQLTFQKNAVSDCFWGLMMIGFDFGYPSGVAGYLFIGNRTSPCI